MNMINIITLALAAFISFSGFTSADEYDEVDWSIYKREVPGRELACNRMYKPVCGTDGQSYNNKCLLCDKQMKLKKFIGIKHTGSCKGAKLKECEQYRDNSICTMEYLPFCGSDGLTYGNLCTYCHAQNSKPDLKLLFVGPCKNDEE